MTNTTIKIVDVVIANSVYGVSYEILKHITLENSEVEIRGISCQNVHGVAYWIYNQSSVSLNQVSISLTNIDVNSRIYGIAYSIGYSDGYADLLIDNISIEINNASGEGVYGVA